MTLVTVVSLHAATTPPAAGPVSHDVRFQCKFSRWLNAPRTMEASQGVTFSSEDWTLETEAAIANLDPDGSVASARSLAPVHLYDSQDDLTGKSGFLDFPHHLATLRDDIVLVVKPGAREAKADPDSPRAKFKDPATLTCAMMTYDYRRKFGRIPGALVVKQKDRELRADAGQYDGKAQTITLVGNVRGHDSQGQQIEASRAIIGIKEGEESLTIPVPTHGIFKVKEEPDDDTAAPAPPEATPAPANSVTSTDKATPGPSDAPRPAPTAGTPPK